MARQPAKKREATPIEQLDDDADYEFVVIKLSQITKRLYDETRRSSDVTAKREFGFLSLERGMTIAYVTKDNLYYRGYYGYRPEEFAQRQGVEWGMELILTNPDTKEAA